MCCGDGDEMQQIHLMGINLHGPGTGSNQEDETKVLLMGGMYEPEGGEEPEETESSLCSQAEGGH